MSHIEDDSKGATALPPSDHGAAGDHNRRYLQTKARRAGHLIPIARDEANA